MGQEDPAIVALRSHWSYEAALDVAGKSGNSSQLGTAASFRATLKAPTDTLQLYTGYDRQTQDGVKSADIRVPDKAHDQWKNCFSAPPAWRVRRSAEPQSHGWDTHEEGAGSGRRPQEARQGRALERGHHFGS